MLLKCTDENGFKLNVGSETKVLKKGDAISVSRTRAIGLLATGRFAVAKMPKVLKTTSKKVVKK